MEKMKVEILSRDLVKPSSPTPAHLRDYKLCLLDQVRPEHHCGIVFFYSSPSETIINSNNNYDYFSILKNSLSDTLTDFYPIAGRFKDTATIDCNDEGACVVEAKINSKLSDFLVGISKLKPSDDPHKNLVKLVPSFDSATMEFASKCILIAQLTVFECGGFAITFSLQHRFCDLYSAVVFLKNWSSRARSGSSGEIPPPDFVASSFLPPREDLPPLPKVDNPIENRTTARLVFDASKIANLKSRFIKEELIGSDGVNGQNISRLEVVLGLILKCAISAARSITSSTPSVVFHAVNLRRRTAPPLPENSIGNLIWLVPVRIDDDQENDAVSFGQVVNKMKRETTSFIDEKVHKIKGDEGSSMVFKSLEERKEIVKKTGDLDLYWVTSWCKFPLYDIDFGWGKPVWVSSGILSSKNLIVLEDTKCGNGVQAWVTLDPRVMPIFERDEELLSFASINPRIA